MKKLGFDIDLSKEKPYLHEYEFKKPYSFLEKVAIVQFIVYAITIGYSILVLNKIL